MKKTIRFIGLLCFIIVITACQSGNDSSTNENNSSNQTNENEQSSEFPVSVSVNDEEVTIPERPTKIMPLSLEVAEIILDLVGPENVVATTRGIDDPLLSSKHSIAEEIEERIQAASNIDPEEIISYDTDLLVMTKMYGQEEDAEKTLNKLEIPILSFDAFVTWDGFMEAYATIGEAIGEKKKAEQNMYEMGEKITEIQKDIPDDQEPSVLVLSEVGGDLGPLMMGPTNISYDMIQLAGAKPAVDQIELTRSTPASMEQIIKMDPDYILFVDFFGKGEAGFADLLEDPGWKTLDAVKQDRTKIVDAKYMINPNPELIEGLQMIVDWLYD